MIRPMNEMGTSMECSMEDLTEGGARALLFKHVESTSPGGIPYEYYFVQKYYLKDIMSALDRISEKSFYIHCSHLEKEALRRQLMEEG